MLSYACTTFVCAVCAGLCAGPQVTDSKGWEWRLMVMPNGNSPESYGHLSVFVEHVNKDTIRMQVRLWEERRRGRRRRGQGAMERKEGRHGGEKGG